MTPLGWLGHKTSTQQIIRITSLFCLDCLLIGRTRLFNSLIHIEPASVAQLDARPTGDQEVAGSTPAGSATFFRGD